jgi:hypothetical protein
MFSLIPRRRMNGLKARIAGFSEHLGGHIRIPEMNLQVFDIAR